uniref:Dihydroflavonol-4-reductase n=1 Tax=Candidatus Kentrum sp. FM TaxID=2126340 RepID=A0A450SHY2_9GAMM|nr:MAG: dihydroflavonol-4-reductase [Candidatus Kentron sp. FM]VFJ54962.1 MAG: dihydroflavonol-4-reductase [Candidatus Kentron sp. FM]VFK09915.1 MAG: dihydroflavonol-4-reductase [Candidatus Kentron sp. FM]
MTTLVTGATGFVGSAVARHLLAAGHRVRVMVRPQSTLTNIQGLDVEITQGDLTRPKSLKTALEGCDTLFHVAADYRLWVRDTSVLYRANVAGTKHLLGSAADRGISRIVYTSSVAALGLNADGTPSNEDTPSTLANMIGHYKRSKYLAEQAVHRMIDQQKLPVIIVNPSTPIGPRDIKPTPTGRMVLDAACGRMPAYVDTGLDVVHVDDVAAGHLLALTRGRIGERYILGGENMTLREILSVISEITRRPTPKIKLPHNLVLPVAYLSEAWARFTNGPEPRATVDGVRMSKKRMYFSSEKAKQILGYSPRPARMALQDAVEWFQENDYCSK